MVKIAQEEEAWRALEASGRALGSGISGYRKGKAPKKRVCMNCLRKGIECEWDEGSQGKPEIYIYILACTDYSDRNLMHSVSKQQNPMYNRRFGAPNVKKASHGGVIDSEATQETEVEASGSYSGSK